MLKKIVVIGPESTGKSSLCDQLALHYKSSWVKEYAREYLLKNGTGYIFEDLLTIANGQLAGENEALLKEKDIQHPSPGNQFLFIDTDLYVMKVWCEFVFDKCHPWILNRIAERKYDLYLLCNIDLPWIKDELREYPDLVTRERLYHHYKDIMINQSVPWTDISGNYKERYLKAVKAIDALWT